VSDWLSSPFVVLLPTAFFTLALYSFLYKDNPLFKLAEHVFAGLTAGYYFGQIFHSVIVQQLWLPLKDDHEWILLFPGILGALLLEERRKRITDPLYRAWKEANALFREVSAPLDEAERTLKDKVAAYHLKAREVQTAAMEAVAAGAPGAALAVPTAHAPGVSVRECWTYRIADEGVFLAEAPARFKAPNHEAIRKHVSMADTPRTPPLPIPGVVFERAADVRVRTA